MFDLKIDKVLQLNLKGTYLLFTVTHRQEVHEICGVIQYYRRILLPDMTSRFRGEVFVTKLMTDVEFVF